MPRVIVQVHIEGFNETDGSACVVHEFEFGNIDVQTHSAASAAATNAIIDWSSRRSS